MFFIKFLRNRQLFAQLMWHVKTCRDMTGNLHVMSEVARELDKGGTLVFRNPDGTEREVHIPQLHSESDLEPARSTCSCHTPDEVAIKPVSESDLKSWYAVWSADKEFVPDGLVLNRRKLARLWKEVHRSPKVLRPLRKMSQEL